MSIRAKVISVASYNDLIFALVMCVFIILLGLGIHKFLVHPVS